jgi:hypothetical protein
VSAPLYEIGMYQIDNYSSSISEINHQKSWLYFTACIVR